ncbi:MAG: bifunctional (p)ppGpp synthetase/guanosine-3',5'-bis(diphosphate) 3'-pyrophosphohydrolase, partial [Firmicutes bacterium]|nr:bifunctional (p)ppGpp synthetase/guanosine-3',5'-bis(diphosphate) 3'-pyrophosphohydrolase [Bacillota bacterium]
MTAPTERVFHEIELMSRVWDYAESRGMKQSLWALDFAAKKHDGQTRKGPEGVPYISHPLYMACQAISLGIADDDMLAAVLLHDVCEDCGVLPEKLQVD